LLKKGYDNLFVEEGRLLALMSRLIEDYEDRTYESRKLWQFFASRIPSPARAEVVEILEREQIEEDDAVSLLKRFGRRTVTNPFELVAKP
jgi:hypothetical protein